MITIKLSESGIIKQQNLKIKKNNIVVYGKNSSGKSSLLKQLNSYFYSQAVKSILHGADYELYFYIPTNRLIVSESMTKIDYYLDSEENFNDYNNSAAGNMPVFLKTLRDYVLQSDYAKVYIEEILEKLFPEDTIVFNEKHSDGIDNVINILVIVIWVLLDRSDIVSMDVNSFKDLMKSKHAIIMIDEIEMFLHVAIQSKLIDVLASFFPKVHFIMTTHSPLVLSRHKDLDVYSIERGILQIVDKDLFYLDLDVIYEDQFEVLELPAGVKDKLRIIGDVALGKEVLAKSRIGSLCKKVEREYPNIAKTYAHVIAAAKKRGK